MPNLVAANPYTDDRLHRPLEWPLRIVAVVVSFISGTIVYSEIRLPDPKWMLILAAILFGSWFGFLGIIGRRPEIRKFRRPEIPVKPRETHMRPN